MSAIQKATIILITVLVINTLAAFVATQGATATGGSIANCSQSYNATTVCQSVGTSSFLASVFSITFTGFDGAPQILNVVWGIVMGGLLVAATVMIVSRFIPLLGGDA